MLPQNRKTFFTVLSLSLLAGVIFSAALVNRRQTLQSSAAPNTSLSFSLPTTTINPNNTFTVTVLVNTGTNFIVGGDLAVQYDQTKLQALSVAVGPFLPNASVPSNTNLGTSNGQLTFSVLQNLTSAPSPKQGSGTFATIQFKALAAGSSTLTFTNSTIIAAINENYQNVLVSSTPGTVKVAPPFDVDGNGQVNLLDYNICSSKVGTVYPACDFNVDGTVTSADIALLQAQIPTPIPTNSPTPLPTNSPTPIPVPVVDLRINGNPSSVTVNPGTSVTLSWTTTNANACTASVSIGSNAGWVGAKATSGSQALVVNATTGFVLVCSNAGSGQTGDTALANVTVVGDINKDGKVDIFDYNLLMTDFGKTGTGLAADLNADSKVDFMDYNLVATGFNPTTAPGTGTGVNLSPQTPKTSLVVGEEAVININAATNADTISAAQISIASGAQVQFVKLEVGTALPSVLVPAVVTTSPTNRAQITVGTPMNAPFKGTGLVAKLTVKAVSPIANLTIGLDQSPSTQVVSIGYTGNRLLNSTNPGTINLSITAPTSTPTPSPAPIPGDIDRSGSVNLLDYTILFDSYGKTPGQTGYDARADINADGKISILDYVVLFEHFGQSQ